MDRHFSVPDLRLADWPTLPSHSIGSWLFPLGELYHYREAILAGPDSGDDNQMMDIGLLDSDTESETPLHWSMVQRTPKGNTTAPTSEVTVNKTPEMNPIYY